MAEGFQAVMVKHRRKRNETTISKARKTLIAKARLWEGGVLFSFNTLFPTLSLDNSLTTTQLPRPPLLVTYEQLPFRPFDAFVPLPPGTCPSSTDALLQSASPEPPVEQAKNKGNQKSSGNEVAKNRADVKVDFTGVQEMVEGLQGGFNRVKTRKESRFGKRDTRHNSHTRPSAQSSTEWSELPNPKALARTHLPRKAVGPEILDRAGSQPPQGEKCSALLNGNDIHESESDWCYWHFMVIFTITVAPVQELTFTIHTLRRQKLALLYVIILTGYALLSLAGLEYRTAVWLWTGDDIAKVKKIAPEEGEKSLRSEPESTGKDRGLVGWLTGPAKTMQLLIVKGALLSKKAKEIDAKQGVAVEDAVKSTDSPHPT
ncbi:hypothetical protein HOY80DRAFT_1061207 [Tuber brumale]|nr:hypothetical protein HOY80DRAFT_1061207 [Tuber brumale]